MIDLRKYIPVLGWGAMYSRTQFSGDMLAACIVTIMLIPQSLAYALLAGLPAEAGLYASILPIILYAVFGTSRALAVGPVAIVSLMTAATLGQIAAQGTMGYATAALTLAFLSGGILLAMGLFRLGFLGNFLSHPVITGFITASGLIIATSQIKHILGVEASGHNLIALIGSLLAALGGVNWATCLIGLGAIGTLFWVKFRMKRTLIALGLGGGLADALAKAGPVFVVVATTLIVWGFDLENQGVKIVGDVPQRLPPLTMPNLSMDLVTMLFLPALLISIIGFVESISVAQTLAAKKRQRIDPDQELIGLGAANMGAAFTGGLPVTGGFARSVVNFDAGAETPAAGAFTAVGLAISAMFLTPLIFFLPQATLAATIIVAVVGLIDFSILKRSWSYSKADFFAVLATIVLTLSIGVEAGVTAGMMLSIILHLYKTTKPHIAEIGLIPDTQHFRNIDRHGVTTQPHVLSLRIDESLYFANAKFLENFIYDRLAGCAEIKHVVLKCSAVNEIDLSALETLEAINERLGASGVALHLSDIKGPVMDRLAKEHFLTDLTGQVFLCQYDAYSALADRS